MLKASSINPRLPTSDDCWEGCRQHERCLSVFKTYTAVNSFMQNNNQISSFSPETGSFLALLIFMSIAGNILVCVAIYTERSLRRIGNLFLASLAIADLFVASLVMTFAGVNDILGERRTMKWTDCQAGHQKLRR